MKELLSKVLPKGKFWTDAWSLVEGCTPVSPGCAHCWLAAMENRFHGQTRGNEQGDSRLLVKDGQFSGLVFCREDRLSIPLHAKKPRVYAIWSDLFHECVSVDFINRAFDTMNRAKHHRFIIITKRPLRAVQYMASWPQWSPMANVTIMVTMEDQKRVQERWKHAVQLAGKGWHVGILAEPLLSPITIDPSWLGMMTWLITGGESGPGARPAHPDWFRSLRDQAQAASIPFLFKQWGEWGPGSVHIGTGQPVFRAFKDKQQWVQKGSTWVNGGACIDLAGVRLQRGGDFDAAAFPVAVVHKMGKKKAGRTLDGREWLEVPDANL